MLNAPLVTYFIPTSGISTLTPEKSPDLLLRPKFTKLRSPERSPILTRRSRSHERSPERARHLRQLKHRSLEIPAMLSRSPDISKRRSHYHEGSSESYERLLDQASTPIPIPPKPPTSHSPSSSETTPEKSSPQGDDTVIEGHVKTESEDSMGGSEAVTPKLEEPPTDLGRPDRSASVIGEVEQLPPLPEETLLSPDVVSPSLKVASTEKQKETTVGGSETSKPLVDEQLLFDMLSNKEGSTEISHDVSNEPQSQDGQNISRKAAIQEGDQRELDRAEGADDILAELDELDVILDAEEEVEEEGEEVEPREGGGAKQEEEADTAEKELGGIEQARTDTGDGREKEEHREVDNPVCEESGVPPDSAIANEVESKTERPVEAEGRPPVTEPPSDLESGPPEITIEVTEDNKQEPSTEEAESARPSQVHVESPPEGEPKPPEAESAEPPMMEDVKIIAPLPPSAELELPDVEPVPDSKRPDIGREPRESVATSETSEVEHKHPEIRPGEPEVEGEGQSTEPEPAGITYESSLAEPSEVKVEKKVGDQCEPPGDKPEWPETAAKEETSELQEKAVDTNAEPTHMPQDIEITTCHKEPPETSSKTEGAEASNQPSVHESSGEVEQPIANLTDGKIDVDGRRTTEDSPTKSKRGSDQSPTKSEGESAPSPAKSEGESDQVATEDEKAKSEQSLKKEDSIQESDER